MRIALGADCSATFAGPGLTPRMLVTWLEGLVARARERGTIDEDLASFAKALSAEVKP